MVANRAVNRPNRNWWRKKASGRVRFRWFTAASGAKANRPALAQIHCQQGVLAALKVFGKGPRLLPKDPLEDEVACGPEVDRIGVPGRVKVNELQKVLGGADDALGCSIENRSGCARASIRRRYQAGEPSGVRNYVSVGEGDEPSPGLGGGPVAGSSRPEARDVGYYGELGMLLKFGQLARPVGADAKDHLVIARKLLVQQTVQAPGEGRAGAEGRHNNRDLDVG